MIEPCIVCGHNCIWCTIEQETKTVLQKFTTVEVNN